MKSLIKILNLLLKDWFLKDRNIIKLTGLKSKLISRGIKLKVKLKTVENL
jgi:hypothetical protein